jgi:hypothetical protein
MKPKTTPLEIINRIRKDRALLRFVRSWVLPIGIESYDLHSYISTDLLGHTDFDLHDAEQLATVRRWGLTYQSLYRTLRDDPAINIRGQGMIINDFYPSPDAEIYASVIADKHPTAIIEVGSGYSTRIARRTLDTLGYSTKLIAIDPQPRAEVTNMAEILFQPVEQINIQQLPLQENAILFIDSSHITRSRGDIPFLFNRVLPELPAGTVVHVHDIFTPYDYPYIYQQRFYTEQYILQALLTHSTRYRVRLATHYLSRTYLADMQATFVTTSGSDSTLMGASFWFDVV